MKRDHEDKTRKSEEDDLLEEGKQADQWRTSKLKTEDQNVVSTRAYSIWEVKNSGE